MTNTTLTVEQKIEIISSHIGSRFLSLAKLLREIQEEDIQLFLKTVKLSRVGVRKAYALARIDRQFDGLNIPEERLYYIGWTKLQIIGRHLNDQNAEQLLQLAAAHTAHDLESKLCGELPVKNARVVQ